MYVCRSLIVINGYFTMCIAICKLSSNAILDLDHDHAASAVTNVCT